MTTQELRRHLQVLAAEARYRAKRNKYFDSRRRAEGAAAAYQNAVELLALLDRPAKGCPPC